MLKRNKPLERRTPLKAVPMKKKFSSKTQAKKWAKRLARRRRLPKRKASRLEAEALYNAMRIEILNDPKHKWCPVALSGVLGYVRQVRSTQCHHIRKRAGKLLYEKRFLMGVSAEGHSWINANETEAKLRLWVLPADNKAWRTWVLNNQGLAIVNGWATCDEIIEFEKQTENERSR